jgi:SAM-dependent methyltransferase
MHDSAFSYVRDFFLDLKARHPDRFYLVLEFGSRDVNGTIRSIFPDEVYWGIDLSRGQGVDEVADAATYTFGMGSADIVVCCETLEHTRYVNEIIRNAYRNLVLGGWLVVTCATHPRAPHSAVDGGPLRKGEYYGNVKPEDLKKYAVDVGFNVYKLEVKTLPRHGGDLYMVARKPTSA